MTSPKKSASTPEEFELFCDGSCLGNPGPGGFSAILRDASGNETIFRGGAKLTTNNRMELLAAITPFKTLSDGARVHVITDSQYVIKGITEWIQGWKTRGWKNAQKEAVKNQDLWEHLDKETSRLQVTWEWIRGHTGHPENERCDEMAREEAEQQGLF